MRRLTAVVHALEVRRAYATCDHTLFWELYSTAPKLGRAVMDFVVPTFRFSAAKQLVEGVRPTVPVSAVAVVLGFWLPQGGTGGAGHTGAQQGPPQSEQSVEQPPPGCSSAVFKGLAEPEVRPAVECSVYSVCVCCLHSAGGPPCSARMTPDPTAVPLCAPCQAVPASMHLLPTLACLQRSSPGWAARLQEQVAPLCARTCLSGAVTSFPQLLGARPNSTASPLCPLQEDQEEAAALCLDWLHEHSAVIKEQPGGSCIPVHRAHSALPITALPCVDVHVHA